MVGVPQLSVAVTVPGAGRPVGLQPRFEPSGQDVITGSVTSFTETVNSQSENTKPDVDSIRKCTV